MQLPVPGCWGTGRAMLEVLRAAYPHDRTVRLAYAYYFNDRRKSRLVRGLVGRLIVPQNCASKKPSGSGSRPRTAMPPSCAPCMNLPKRRLPAE